jgi:biotin carboxylase
MRVMILGAGYNQLYAIEKIKNMGHKAVVSDYSLDSPGKRLADIRCLASNFSYEETLAAATGSRADAIYTTGSDQPVYIASQVAGRLDLPSNLEAETAYQVTNKKAMKKRFQEVGIPSMNSQLVDKSTGEDEVRIGYPAVLKPQDSQGQRGLFLIRSFAELQEKLKDTLAASREGQALLESYYPSDEITISGWVQDGKAKILSVCDRLRFTDEDKLGICVAHEYPSKYYGEHAEQIWDLTESIVEAFGIEQGPIYFQMLIGENGLVVNEIACRIGGAFEDIYIEKCLGVDIAKMQIMEALGQDAEKEYEALQNTSFPSGSYMTVELFFARPGTVSEKSSRQELLQIPGVIDASSYYRVGDTIEKTRTASQRAGFAILCAPDRDTLEKRVDAFYRMAKLLDETGTNMILRRGKKA